MIIFKMLLQHKHVNILQRWGPNKTVATAKMFNPTVLLTEIILWIMYNLFLTFWEWT